jgi:hypothetical protein
MLYNMYLYSIRVCAHILQLLTFTHCIQAARLAMVMPVLALLYTSVWARLCDMEDAGLP